MKILEGGETASSFYLLGQNFQGGSFLKLCLIHNTPYYRVSEHLWVLDNGMRSKQGFSLGAEQWKEVYSKDMDRWKELLESSDTLFKQAQGLPSPGFSTLRGNSQPVSVNSSHQ